MTNNTTTDLITQLSHPDGSLRREAALRLGATHDPAAGDALIERLRVEENSRVREDLTWAAVQHSEALMPRLLTMLSDPDPHARRIGAHVLSKVGDPARLPELLPLVDDADASVAIKAYRAVANTGRPEALGPLAGRLGDGDALQKDALTGAFHRFGELSVGPLVAALADEDADVRTHAADALGHLGTDADAAADALDALTTDAEPAVRVAAVAALGQLGDVADAPLQRLTASEDATVAGIASRLQAKRAGERRRADLREQVRARAKAQAEA